MERGMKLKTAAAILALTVLFGAVPSRGEIESYRKDVDYSSYLRFDRYLNVEVWTDDDQYYDGENITISFRADKDCYVVLYNIDTRGNVHLLYPTDRGDDFRIERDRVYRIPDSYDDYDLTVRGPEGVEYIQAVASLTPLAVPDFDREDLVCYDDPVDFLDYVNAVYFGDDPGLRLATDMTIINVQEWNDAYYRPVHVYRDYDWSLSGTVYIDYPWGGTVYIDGVYWGIAPLYIPRLYWGWHYVTIYDPWGYCWEDRVNVYRHRTVYIDETIVKTRAEVKSRYRDVVRQGYLDPEKNGYPEYQKTVRTKQAAMTTYKEQRARGEGSLTKSRYGGESRYDAGKRGNSDDAQGKASTRDDNAGSREKRSSSSDNGRYSPKSRGSSQPVEKSSGTYESKRERKSDSSGKSRSSDSGSSQKRSSASQKSGDSGTQKATSTPKSSDSGSSSRSKGDNNSGNSGSKRGR